MKKIAALLALAAFALWAGNTSLFHAPRDGHPLPLAHRGVHQTYAVQDLDADTCTAARIRPPVHGYMENTLASMRAAFEAGARTVELDVHLTPDGKFAVFHDWTLDCRTNGHGVTQDTPMTVLRTLDVGHGYTADDGRTWPLRGRGVGQMPTLDEVLDAFPGGRFLVNFKSRREEEGRALAEMLAAHPAWREAVMGVYGGAEPTRASIARVPGLRGYDRASTLSCLLRYELQGWSGIVPEACRNTLVIVPVNYAWALWGWPYRFAARMREAGSEVIVMGAYSGGGFSSGIDTPADLAQVPARFPGHVWTNRIETMGGPIRAH
ncbi:glycerophosphodiester phosphodiesterase family protein [Pigmentiphaga sp. GD03639]|uniref:Glycerophosphodiester phosphodiesterase family protein n=1 Tax=Pigmentiphaga daeguensis TaxID=414049 RepID=A0ABN1D2W0_9BURK|nr:glycerophosphodiester phosphodiesterase family protein [Pigmentiphaga sp. GD03639]MDH2236486.1 glycerophosphodiester phosphodiesterase family protein [Pigmentiphaga sp. GD03639]